jgi:hypothetical protein
MYRFLPILAEKRGFKTKEVKCLHHQEQGKTGFYSLFDYLTRLIDILTLYFNTRYSRKPLRFFSSIGIALLSIGLGTTAYPFIQRLFMGHPIGNRPVLFLGIFLMVMGVLVASAGLLGEIITFTYGRQKKEYAIEKVI